MTRRTYTDQQRAEALELHRQHGPREAARQTGIPTATIASWARRGGVQTDTDAAVAHVRARTEAAKARWAEITQQRREELAARLLAEAHALLDQVQGDVVYRQVVTLSGGKGFPATWEIVDVEVPHPTAKDQQLRVAAVAQLVDKLQLLTGEPTERHATDGAVIDWDRELRELAKEGGGRGRK
jgi:hypothetical protein